MSFKEHKNEIVRFMLSVFAIVFSLLGQAAAFAPIHLNSHPIVAPSNPGIGDIQSKGSDETCETVWKYQQGIRWQLLTVLTFHRLMVLFQSDIAIQTSSRLNTYLAFVQKTTPSFDAFIYAETSLSWH